MADVQGHLEIAARAQRVAWVALVGAAVLMALKFCVFFITNSAAVLSDALESIVNLATAATAALSTWYAAKPPDKEHPYGHGKIEFFAVGFDGAMIIFAGSAIIFESSRRLIIGTHPQRLDVGFWGLLGVDVLVAALSCYVYFRGRRLGSPTLIADGKHLFTDVVTTLGIALGLGLVHITGLLWLDPVLAIVVAVLIFVTGFKLLRESWGGLLDEMDAADDRAIRAILSEEIAAGHILGFHKLRHRHTGAFHWVDLHIQVDGEMSVREAHDLATRIENRIEQKLGRADATAHIEPPENVTE
jgi:cation diffusion facilitator family transporter